VLDQDLGHISSRNVAVALAGLDVVWVAVRAEVVDLGALLPPAPKLRNDTVDGQEHEQPHRAVQRSANGRRAMNPAIGHSATRRNPSRQDAAPTTAAKAIGKTMPPSASAVCWMPIAAPLRAAPARSAAAV